MSLADAAITLLGGATALYLFGFIGQMYHNWIVRRELRLIRKLLTQTKRKVKA